MISRVFLSPLRPRPPNFGVGTAFLQHKKRKAVILAKIGGTGPTEISLGDPEVAEYKAYSMKLSILRHPFYAFVCLGLMGGVTTAEAVVVDPIQSLARPLGLVPVAPVDMRGTDASSAAFLSALPSLTALIQAHIPASHTGTIDAASMALDPASLRLATDTAVRVYFLGESAGNHNTLGFNAFAPGAAIPTASTPGITSNAKLIFPNMSSSEPGSISVANNSVRTEAEPLLTGDFVNLGNFSAGTLLDFFFIAYGASGGTTALTDETTRNFDNFQHIVAFASPGSPYLVISFEDSYHGGDKDYNDGIFALEFTPISTVAPEPGTLAGLIGLGLVASFNILRGVTIRRTA